MSISEEIKKINEGIIEAFGHGISMFGMNGTLGRILGLLFFADEPMSLDEMAKELMVSKATISINIRILEDLATVYKVWKKGSRKDYYTAERDFDKILQGAIRRRASFQMDLFHGAIKEAIKGHEEILASNITEDEKKQVKKELDKIHTLVYWIQISESWMNFFLKADVTEVPGQEIKRIEVKWEEEE